MIHTHTLCTEILHLSVKYEHDCAAHVLDGVEFLSGVLKGLREAGQLAPTDTYGDVLNRVSLLPCGQLVPCQAPQYR